jgi:hypothetical protein
VIALPSSITGKEQNLGVVKQYLESHGFSIGGNWDYDGGYFDCSLDEAQKLWLRIPFAATRGAVDSEAADTDARIKIGEPFVLKHLYNEGTSDQVPARIVGGLTDQFQEPVNPDAELSRDEVKQAESLLRRVEESFPQ